MSEMVNSVGTDTDVAPSWEQAPIRDAATTTPVNTARLLRRRAAFLVTIRPSCHSRSTLHDQVRRSRCVREPAHEAQVENSIPGH